MAINPAGRSANWAGSTGHLHRIYENVQCSKQVLAKTVTRLLAASLLASLQSAVADAATLYFDIPREDLALALNQVAQQSNIDISYSAKLTQGRTSPVLKGMYTPQAALKRILKGSRLRARQLVGGALIIESSGASPNEERETTSKNDASMPMGEIIVTASRRAENQRKVADSVTAFAGEELTLRDAKGFEDYIDSAPGVQFQASTPELSNVTIRGVGTATVYPDQGQATTGIYLNDIPLTDPGFAILIPDVDVFDMQRVEVLRGPQGTLFGTATLGGAVDYITNPVSLDGLEVHAQTGLSKTVNAADESYSAKFALNIPLIDDELGFRFTAVKRYDAGFLDNIGTGRDDSNYRKIEDYRLNVLWRINDGTDLSFFTFYDRSLNGDGFYAFPQLGDLVRDTFVSEYASFVTRINSAKLKSNLDFATLSIQGADSRKSQDSDADVSANYGDIPTSSLSFARTHSDTVEARLTSPANQQIDWLFGTYYGYSYESYPTPYQNSAQSFSFDASYKSNELSEFGEATYHFSDAWRATLGGRHYDIRLTTNTVYDIPPVLTAYQGDQRGTGLSPKASVTYEPAKDLMMYALMSKGFRMGGVNLLAPLAGFPTPSTYKSDRLVDYEIGIRPAWLEHTLTLDTTVFFIDWSDIQLRLFRPDDNEYEANAGAAHNVGLENALNWVASPNLQLHLNATLLQARISKTTDLGNGVVLPEGARIPGAPRWSASELTTYHWSVECRPYVAVSMSFVSAARSDFTVEGQQSVPIMDYVFFDLHVGMNVRQYDLSLYADNIGDRRGVTAAYYGGDAPGQNADRYFYIRPRTVGLQIDWRL